MDNNIVNDLNVPSVKDELTGVYTMSWLMTQLYPAGPIKVAPDAIVLFFNVMNFQSFNRRFGFLGGNDYLRNLAMEMTNIFVDDLVARAGGDHFIIITKNLTEQQVVHKLAELDSAMLKHDRGLHLHLKTGIYHSDGSEPLFVMLIDRAKMACDVVSKVYDRDYVFFDDELKKKNELRQYAVEHFEEALAKGHFTVYYQPVIRAITGEICGFEALARWNDPVHGMIPPSIFVEVLESVRLIHKLDNFIVNRVCQDISDHINKGYVCEPISINLSRLDFELCDVKKLLADAIERNNIPKEYLIVEITESAAATGMQMLVDELSAIREYGLQVWIDDFGSGYSSFNNLQLYDFDTLKIDMEFVKGIGVNPKSEVIISAIISMSKRLNLPTLAEGVETKEQFEFLKRVGCEKIQGYYFGKPAPKEAFALVKDSTLANLEDPEYRKYYDVACSLNFLSSSPLRSADPNLLKSGGLINGTPFTLIEYDRAADKVNFIFYNKAYEVFFSSFGIKSIDDVQDYFGDQGQKTMREVFAEAESKPCERIVFEVELTDEIILHCRIRFLAHHNDRSIFGYVVRRKDT